MKNVVKASIASLLASTVMATAGGLDRSGQSIGLIFETGDYAEFSLSFVSPSVSGTGPISFDNSPTGDMAPTYGMISGGFRTDFSDKISAALIFDQPFGANAHYTEGFYGDTEAALSANAMTFLVSYDVSDRFVVYGGAVAQSMAATARVNNPFFDYRVNADIDTGFGYVVGGAFQIPDIALRVALTYRSEISTSHDTMIGFGVDPDTLVPNTAVTTPQSINLEFQTGINPTTLVFGSVRWAEWSEFVIDPVGYPSAPLVDYDNDVITYSLGVGKKLSDSLSAAVTLGYEAALGGAPDVLAPTDGYFSVGGGVTYTVGNTEITAGAKYLWLGDASDEPFVGTFTGNTALAFGFKIGVSL